MKLIPQGSHHARLCSGSFGTFFGNLCSMARDYWSGVITILSASTLAKRLMINDK